VLSRGTRVRIGARGVALAALALLGAGMARGAVVPVKIYALELEVSREGERLVVLADAPIAARVLDEGPRFLVLAIENAVLDRVTEKRLVPVAGTLVERATAMQRERGGRHEVRIVIDRAAGPAPRVSSAGSALEVDFPHSEAVRNAPVKMEFREASLEEVVRAVARASGETYAFDTGLSGSVTIIAPDAVTAAEAHALLDAALLFKGFVAVPMPGRGRKIVPIARAPAPWRTAIGEGGGDAPVATLLRLEAADAETLLTALRPLLGAYTLGYAYAPTNSLILVGPERRLERIQKAIRALDASEEERIVVWRVYHRSADEIAAQLEEAFDAQVLLDVSADPRSNLLVLRARSARVEELRTFVDRLDRPPIGGGVLHVLPVRYADADQLKIMIESLRSRGDDRAVRGEASLAGREFALAVDPHTRALVLRADPETARLVAEVVAELDRIPPQVLVDVTIAEVATSDTLALGFDYLLPLLTPSSAADVAAGVLGAPSGLAAGTGSLAAGYAGPPLLVPVVDALGNPIAGLDPNFELREFATLTADERQILVRSLLKPSLLVSSGDEHVIFAGENLPVPVSSGGEHDPLQTTQNIERKDVGLQLRVRPTVGQAGSVQMDVDIEVSSLAPSSSGDVTRVGPTFSQRTLSTSVVLDDGAVAVIGFAMVPRRFETSVGVPFLRSIPILGFLFRSTAERALNTTLLVTLQATVERDESAALTQALRRELAREVQASAAQLAAP